MSGAPIALMLSIHLVFSLLWWSTTLVVIFIIRPSNRSGVMSPILPKIRKLVLIASSASIFSGLVLYGLFSNLNFQSYFHSHSGLVILISGSLSLIVYFHVLRGNAHHKFLAKRKSLGKAIQTYIPFIMFGLLTATMISMVIVSATFNFS